MFFVFDYHDNFETSRQVKRFAFGGKFKIVIDIIDVETST